MLPAVETAVRTMADVAIENEAYFSDLDSAAGDADFGTSLATGFRVVLDRWDTLDRSSIGAFLMAVGVIITSKVGGCSGPIWGTAFLKSGIASKGREAIALPDLIQMGEVALAGIMARGGAAPGDKTLIDALAPAIAALRQAHDSGAIDLPLALQAAADAATGAVEGTRDWVAKRGRQSFTGDRSRGTLDPGIVAVSTMMQAVATALAGRP
jgi:dihydroxyacetone kinase phosphoprotein-dependent L subunit